MIVDDDNKIISAGQVSVAQMYEIKRTVTQLKEYADISYVSRLVEEIYDVEKQRITQWLNTFFVSPDYPLFVVDDQSYNAKNQEKVLQWFLERVEYYRNYYNLTENEIIYFEVS